MEKWRERIAAAIANSGLPDKRISVEAGLGPTFIRDLLQRNSEPRVEHLRKLAEHLGLSMEYLFTEESDWREIGHRLHSLRRKSFPNEDNIPWWVTWLGEGSITATAWDAWEKGFGRPSDADIHAIIQRTGVTSDWILYGIPDGMPLHLVEKLEARKPAA